MLPGESAGGGADTELGIASPLWAGADEGVCGWPPDTAGAWAVCPHPANNKADRSITFDNVIFLFFIIPSRLTKDGYDYTIKIKNSTGK